MEAAAVQRGECADGRRRRRRSAAAAAKGARARSRFGGCHLAHFFCRGSSATNGGGESVAAISLCRRPSRPPQLDRVAKGESRRRARDKFCSSRLQIVVDFALASVQTARSRLNRLRTRARRHNSSRRNALGVCARARSRAIADTRLDRQLKTAATTAAAAAAAERHHKQRRQRHLARRQQSERQDERRRLFCYTIER